MSGDGPPGQTVGRLAAQQVVRGLNDPPAAAVLGPLPLAGRARCCAGGVCRSLGKGLHGARLVPPASAAKKFLERVPEIC